MGYPTTVDFLCSVLYVLDMNIYDFVRLKISQSGMRRTALELGVAPQTLAYWMAGASRVPTSNAISKKFWEKYGREFTDWSVDKANATVAST